MSAEARKFLAEEAGTDLLKELQSTGTDGSAATSTNGILADDDDDEEFVLSIVDGKLHGLYEQEKLDVHFRAVFAEASHADSLSQQQLLRRATAVATASSRTPARNSRTPLQRVCGNEMSRWSS
jgi:hypothetical protein